MSLSITPFKENFHIHEWRSKDRRKCNHPIPINDLAIKINYKLI